MSPVLHLTSRINLSRSSSHVSRLQEFFGYVTKPSRFAHWQVAKPLRLPRKPTSESCEVLRTYHFFETTFTFDMCFMHFSTSLPKLVRAWCVLYFLTSKSASLRNGARCVNILTSQSGPSRQFFKLLRGKCTSRHNGVLFFISRVATWPCTPLSGAYFSIL